MAFILLTEPTACNWTPSGFLGDIRTTESIQCMEYEAAYNSNAILSLALYYGYNVKDDALAKKYFEKLVDVGNHPRGIIEYANYLGADSDRYVPLLKHAFSINANRGNQAAEGLMLYYKNKSDLESALFWAENAAKGCSLFATDFLVNNLEDPTDKFFHMISLAMNQKGSLEMQGELEEFYTKNAGSINFLKFVKLANEKWCTPFSLADAIELDRGIAHY